MSPFTCPIFRCLTHYLLKRFTGFADTQKTQHREICHLLEIIDYFRYSVPYIQQFQIPVWMTHRSSLLLTSCWFGDFLFAPIECPGTWNIHGIHVYAKRTMCAESQMENKSSIVIISPPYSNGTSNWVIFPMWSKSNYISPDGILVDRTKIVYTSNIMCETLTDY